MLVSQGQNEVAGGPSPRLPSPGLKPTCSGVGPQELEYLRVLALAFVMDGNELVVLAGGEFAP